MRSPRRSPISPPVAARPAGAPSPRAAARARAERRRAGARSYLAEGSVVTVLGSGANAVDREGHGSRRIASGHRGAGAPPRAPVHETDDLARVAQHVSLTEGQGRPLPDVARAAHQGRRRAELRASLLPPPGAIARPGPRATSWSSRPTTTPRSSGRSTGARAVRPRGLRRATGTHRGRFVHVPWWDPEAPGRRPITVPNEYVRVPDRRRLAPRAHGHRQAPRRRRGPRAREGRPATTSSSPRTTTSAI